MNPPNHEVLSVTRKTTPHYKVVKANWDKFARTYLDRQARNPDGLFPEAGTKERVDSIVERITSDLTTAAKDSIPRKRFKSLPWWTRELTILRSLTNRARARFQQARERHDLEDIVDELQRQHFATKRRYERVKI